MTAHRCGEAPTLINGLPLDVDTAWSEPVSPATSSRLRAVGYSVKMALRVADIRSPTLL